MTSTPIEAILIDLDGTLLSSDLTVPDQCAQILYKAQEQGIRVILASGRHSTVVARFVEALCVDPFALTSNGCAINVVSGKTIFFHPFPRDTWVKLTELATRRSISPVLHAPTDWFIECVDNNIKLEITRSQVTPTIVQFSQVAKPIIKVAIIGDRATLAECEAELGNGYCSEIDWFYTFPEYLEVMPSGVSKGKARDKLLEHLGIGKDNVMAFGNGDNDLEMLDGVGVSIAVANANVSLLQIADYIAPSNDEAGVATAIDALVFGSQTSYMKLHRNNPETGTT